jgi:hypothetical protein
MRTLSDIHAEIDVLSERRRDLWQTLSRSFDAEAREELRRLEAKLDALWDEHRQTRATLRFGERERIVRRARAEERLERAA